MRFLNFFRKDFQKHQVVFRGVSGERFKLAVLDFMEKNGITRGHFNDIEVEELSQTNEARIAIHFDGVKPSKSLIIFLPFEKNKDDGPIFVEPFTFKLFVCKDGEIHLAPLLQEITEDELRIYLRSSRRILDSI